eukprot:1054957-Ditylum_brightwellii.AAC.1
MDREEESTKQEAAVKVKFEEEAAIKVALSVTTKGSGNDGINILYKVETKEIPVLLANKTLKGKIFDEWHKIVMQKCIRPRLATCWKKDTSFH